MYTPSNTTGDAGQLAQTCAALKQQLAQRRAAFYAHHGADTGGLVTPDAAQLDFESGVQDAIRRYFGEDMKPAATAPAPAPELARRRQKP